MAINTEEESGNLLLWILVWSELAAFGALIGAFIITFALNPEEFAAARLHLQPQLAGLNTLILLASGWLAAVAASRHTALPGKRRALVLAGLLGYAFVGVKLYEYSTEIAFASDPPMAHSSSFISCSPASTCCMSSSWQFCCSSSPAGPKTRTSRW